VHRFLLVRHATPSQGDDPGLSERGQVEAAAVAKRLASWKLDAAWSSNLNRAVETARAILAGHQGIALRQSPLLREIDPPTDPNQQVGQPGYRDWETATIARLARELSEWLRLATAGIQGRDPHECPNILVVCHAGPLRVLTCLLLGLPVENQWAFRHDWASFSVVERADDMGTLTLLNDRCHLETDTL
jgi:broad specificity phosphatase PhoE